MVLHAVADIFEALSKSPEQLEVCVLSCHVCPWLVTRLLLLLSCTQTCLNRCAHLVPEPWNFAANAPYMLAVQSGRHAPEPGLGTWLFCSGPDDITPLQLLLSQRPGFTAHARILLRYGAVWSSESQLFWLRKREFRRVEAPLAFFQLALESAQQLKQRCTEAVSAWLTKDLCATVVGYVGATLRLAQVSFGCSSSLIFFADCDTSRST